MCTWAFCSHLPTGASTAFEGSWEDEQISQVWGGIFFSSKPQVLLVPVQPCLSEACGPTAALPSGCPPLHQPAGDGPPNLHSSLAVFGRQYTGPVGSALRQADIHPYLLSRPLPPRCRVSSCPVRNCCLHAALSPVSVDCSRSTSPFGRQQLSRAGEDRSVIVKEQFIFEMMKISLKCCFHLSVCL